MDSLAIFKKTALGQEAFAKRSPELNPRQRSVLIMIDGKRDVGVLSRLAAACGDVPALIADLEAMGMVQADADARAVNAKAAAASASRAAAPSPAPGAAPSAGVASASAPAIPRSLKDAQRFAVRALNDALGPSAETACMRIESGKNPAEVLGAVQRAAELLAGARSKAAAQSLLDGVALRLPE